METICLIVSGLALLAASISLALLIIEVKRNQKRNTAALQYADKTREQTVKMAEKLIQAGLHQIDEQHFAHMEDICKRIEKLEAGAVPDYEAQKDAADAVNDFAKGISAILGYDPMDVLRREREQGR